MSSKAAGTSLRPLLPKGWPAFAWIATIESAGSSTRIEGAKLTDAEVEKLLSGMETTSFASRDEQEVAGYADAMDMIFDGHDAVTLTDCEEVAEQYWQAQ